MPADGSEGSFKHGVIVENLRPVFAKWKLLLGAAGLCLVVGGWQWDRIVAAGDWFSGNLQLSAVLAGALFLSIPGAAAASALIGTGRRPRIHDTPAEDLARFHLRSLRYVATRTRTATGGFKSPFGLELGGSTSQQAAERLKSYPELVAEFRRFLGTLALDLRSRPGRASSKIVVCIDELDKISAAEAVERFINDIKAVFGVEGCFFLVAVSEDALTSFSRGVFEIRTAFDTAFDSVIQVQRFQLADTRRLLVQRAFRLPEPFIWFCHCMSGGLARDLNRIVRLLYDMRVASGSDHLSRLAALLIAKDLELVAYGQSLRLVGATDAYSREALEWLTEARRSAVDSENLLALCRKSSTPLTESDHAGFSFDLDGPVEAVQIVREFRAYLYYIASVAWSFCEEFDRVLECGRRSTMSDDENPVNYLADARSSLSTGPRVVSRAVDEYRRVFGLALLAE